MYAFRLWKRVHRPFIFFGLCCMSVVLIGFTSATANIQNVQPKIDLGKEAINSESSSEFNTNYGVHEDKYLNQRMGSKEALDNLNSVIDPNLLLDKKHGKSPIIKTENGVHPIDPVPQLPFCNSNLGNNEKRDVNTGANKKRSQDVDESKYRTSDELVPILGNSRAIGHPEWVHSGRHVVVATLDGQVSLLDHTGQILWSICTGQLFSSTISTLQLSEDGKLINLIPSLTGGLYKYDGDSLQPMPLNADSLLKKSFKLSNDVVITGGKELRTFGVDVDSGSIRYECGFGDCYYPPQASDSDAAKRPILVIKKQSQIVRAIDSTTGSEKWNFSVGTHEITLAGLTDPGCYDEEMHKTVAKNNILKVIIPEGLVIGADAENKVLWQQRFGSPISQAWIVENGNLVSIDTLRSSPLLAEEPALYVGMHKKQLYVQESQTTAEKVEQIFGLDSSSNGYRKDKVDRLKLEWKTSYAVAANSENTALTSFTPPPNWASVAFKPFYVFERDDVTTTQMPAIEESSYLYTDDETDDSDSEDNSTYNMPEFDDDDGPIQIIFVSLWYWWKEVLGISVLTAVILNILLMRPIIRAVRTQTIREMLPVFNFRKGKEKEDEKALVLRRSSDELELPSSSTIRARQRTVSSSSNNSQLLTLEDMPFSSQYLREFEPIQCLGRGGFGVVFEAKKKIDDRHYAVKRIPLPNREKSRVRVMREVKALAQLDHKNIVRYFNAWTENPPSGWLEKNDPLWNSRMGSSSPTMEYPSDLLSSSSLDLSYPVINRKKPDHSKISFPNTPVEEEPNDSFIVFEAPSQASFAFEKSNDSSVFLKLNFSETTRPFIESSIIPISEENSTSSSTGKGFYDRPTSLNIPSTSGFKSYASVAHSSSSHSNSDCKEQTDNSVDGKCFSENCSVMYLYIQQELCQKRTLQDWLRAENNRNILTVVKFFAQIVDAVEYVHTKKLIHRDLKPSNIFLAGDGVNIDISSMTVKIGDFGLATTALSELESNQGSVTPLDNQNSSVRVNLTGHVGTHLYMSPEQYQKKPYDYKVDIYSLGLIFFELLVPFSTDMERHEVLSRVRKLKFPSKFSEVYPIEYKQIGEMVSHNPTERPDAKKIKEWVKLHLENLPLNPETTDDADLKVFSSQSDPSFLNSEQTNRFEDNQGKPRPKFYKAQSFT